MTARLAPLSAKDNRNPAVIPARCLSIKIGGKSVGIRVGCHQPVLFEPQRVCRPDLARGLVDFINQIQNGFLVRDGDIAARQSRRPVLESRDEGRQVFRRHFDRIVAAFKACLFEPVAMDQRRTGMADRITNDKSMGLVIVQVSHQWLPALGVAPAAAEAAGR